MRKLLLLITGGIAFVLGSRAGRGPYESLERGVKQLRKQPQVQQLIGEDDSGSSSQTTASVRSA